ncbi:MAG TPA: hypothetical protein PL151_10990 [Phycisphaerae bacterium]|nr:hypothetical protein [Phycisphaerae bacterium]HOJ73454.1 hypothetical protein [Phycisphaerae bacterium]HOM51063.1 hypothetical protein [Phycisphaerae bacterium]HON66163.1 hypothetical protein [Phycisphaerae bacterium]HOQ86584.1 hypothetical protein [Phycisphaerae bacterium]
MQEILIATAADGTETRYVLKVTQEGDHWASTLGKLGPGGEVESTKVAPRFYGMTEEQARRRMIGVLENQFEEVRSLRKT